MPQLLVDNGSLYTDKLYSLLADMGCDPIRLKPDKIDRDALSKYDSFVLSGRRINDKNTNMVNSKIITHAIDQKIPLFGVCYGSEIIALTCGGAIKKMDKPRQGLCTIKPTTKNELCTDSMRVFESHRYEISTLSKTLVSIASSAECTHEIIHIKDTPIYGTQFHPEMSDDGGRILAEFARGHLGMT